MHFSGLPKQLQLLALLFGLEIVKFRSGHLVSYILSCKSEKLNFNLLFSWFL